MPSIFKLALPITLAVSPLLLAATPPRVGAAGGDCDWESAASSQRGGRAIAPNAAQYPARNVTAQPIAHPSGALVTSEQEVTNLSRAAEPASQNRLVTAIRLLLNNPYTADRTPTPPVDQVPSHCITQVTPEME